MCGQTRKVCLQPPPAGDATQQGTDGSRIAQAMLGAALAGGMIGAASGIGVGGLFLLIVKPAKQLMMADPAAEF